MSRQAPSYEEGWEAVYRSGPTIFDAGEPLAWVVSLAADGGVRGRVLDAGCGGGHNALYLARRGYDVTGIDVSPTVIARAKDKVVRQGVHAEFAAGDVLDLTAWRDGFDTVIDIGCFHSLYPADRSRYAAALWAACRPEARLHLRCFSDRNAPGFAGPGTAGLSASDLETAFAEGWEIQDLSAARDDVLVPERRPVWFWYATATRRP